MVKCDKHTWLQCTFCNTGEKRPVPDAPAPNSDDDDDAAAATGKTTGVSKKRAKETTQELQKREAAEVN